MMRLGDFVVHNGATTTHSCPTLSTRTIEEAVGSLSSSRSSSLLLQCICP